MAEKQVINHGHNFKDLSGKRFGKLVVVSISSKRGNRNQIYWTCNCDCGRTITTVGNNLQRNQSCGCHRPTRIIDISGKIFGRLTVISLAFTKRLNNGVKTFWNCQCECGNSKILMRTDIVSGHTKSCGCLDHDSLVKRNTKHGMWTRPEFNVWVKANGRCFNPADAAYKNYGGRGITMCEEWRNSFQAFISDMGYRPSPKHTIERIDNDGPYSADNCKWATQQEQTANQRRTIRITHNGETQCLMEWSRRLGICYGTLLGRYTRNPNRSDLLSPPRHITRRKT